MADTIEQGDVTSAVQSEDREGARILSGEPHLVGAEGRVGRQRDDTLVPPDVCLLRCRGVGQAPSVVRATLGRR